MIVAIMVRWLTWLLPRKTGKGDEGDQIHGNSLVSFLKIWRRCTRIIDDPGVVA